MPTPQPVALHAEAPFNPRSFSAIELKQRVKNRGCIVFVGDTGSVDAVRRVRLRA